MRTSLFHALLLAGALTATPALAAPEGGGHGGTETHEAAGHGESGHGDAHGDEAHGEGHGGGHHVLDPWADDNGNGTANFLDAEDEHYANSWGHPVWLQWVWHLLNLLILVGGLGFLARKPIAAALRDRSLGIKAKLDESADLEAAARARHEELQRRLAGFEAEVAEMRAEAENAAGSEKDEIMRRADESADRIAEAAERAIRDETARATRELRAEAVELATKLAEETLRNKLGAQDRERLARDLLTSLGAQGGTHG